MAGKVLKYRPVWYRSGMELWIDIGQTKVEGCCAVSYSFDALVPANVT